MCYNVTMKKFVLFILILILTVGCLGLTSCKKDNDDNDVIFIPTAPFKVTLIFDLKDIEASEINPISYVFGWDNQTLPIPSDAEEVDGYRLTWFLDNQTTIEFQNDPRIASTLGYKANDEITLYLGYAPRTYSITYTNLREFDFQGEFPDSFTYGEGVSLPQVNLGVGYQINSGNWYYGDGENDYFTTGVSTTCCQDLILTYVPKPIVYHITYSSGEVNLDMINPNPLEYDITMDSIILQPASAEGKVFSHWEYRSTKERREITSIDINLFLESMSFTIWAVWDE